MHYAHSSPQKWLRICLSHASYARLRRTEQAPSSSRRDHICAAQHKLCERSGRRLGWSNLQQRRSTMSLLTHPAASTLPTPVERKPSCLVRLVHAIVAPRTRMYLTAVTDPTTGRIDPVLEQRVLRMIAL